MKGVLLEHVKDVMDKPENVNGFRIESRETERGLRIVHVENENFIARDVGGNQDVIVLENRETVEDAPERGR